MVPIKVIGPALILIVSCAVNAPKTKSNIVKYTAYSRNTPYNIMYVNERNKWSFETVNTNYWLKVVTVKFKGEFMVRIEKPQCMDNDSVTISVDTWINGCESKTYKPTPWNSFRAVALNYNKTK